MQSKPRGNNLFEEYADIDVRKFEVSALLLIPDAISPFGLYVHFFAFFTIAITPRETIKVRWLTTHVFLFKELSCTN